jgi:hypothetical protein
MQPAKSTLNHGVNEIETNETTTNEINPGQNN